MITVWIDDFTPCLKDESTGELVDTEVVRLKEKVFLKSIIKIMDGILIGLSYLMQIMRFMH
ncbi:hypothetical protein CIY_16200 [Butyrivibrio fibrisolvens 16/4]|nr:hypothetical protein CIY_16200 [Butyrivibrio fibrisolvens 16/4]